MRTIAALLAAFPLFAAAQTAPAQAPAAPPPQTWVTEPPPAAAPAQAPAAQPAPATAQPAYPPQPQTAPPQYAPPPQAAPPAPPAPVYAKVPQKTRSSWYIGFGIGGGDGKVANETATSDFKDLHYGGMTNVFMNFKVGATLTPKLLLGGDISVLSSVADKDGIATSLAVANIDAMVTYFPTVKGFFLRGGLGPSSVSYAVDATGFGTQDGSASGFNVTGGLGYAWWIGQHFNLTANLDFSRQWYSSSTDLNVDDSQFWSLWLGFDWY